MCKNDESQTCTPETNNTLYVNKKNKTTTTTKRWILEFTGVQIPSSAGMSAKKQFHLSKPQLSPL